jgi:hypothetical protein
MPTMCSLNINLCDTAKWGEKFFFGVSQVLENMLKNMEQIGKI